MEDWRSSSCLTNGFEHYATYNGRSSWGGRANRTHSRSSSRASSRPNSRRGSKDFSSTEVIAKQNNQKQKAGNKKQAQSKMKLEKEPWNVEQTESLGNDNNSTPASTAPEAKSPPPTVAMNSGQWEAQEETVINEDKEREKEDLIVAAKNEENSKQTASLKAGDSTHSSVIESAKLVLKHNYTKDQWSPLNPEGKKKYDRDFIMELKDDPQSKKKPENLPNLDLLKDNTKQRLSDRSFMNAMCRDMGDGLLPSFANKNLTQRSSQVMQKKSSQTSKPKTTKTPVIHMSLHQDVKLHETENAWKPARNNNYNNRTEDEIKTEELYKRVRSILNKLTPEKFSTLVDQLRELQIDNRERLSGVIDLVFEKAVDEPSFSVAYAQMCHQIQHIQVATGDHDSEGKPIMTSFKKLLLTRCQKEFEKDTDRLAIELKKKEDKYKEMEQETDPEKKKQLQLQYEEEERKVRKKSVGNSRFIGELYKLKMLTCNIMHQCIGRLLNEGDEESLECLCKLLTTVGRGFEQKALNDSKVVRKDDDNRKYDPYQELNNYFKRLGDIVKNKGSKKVSSRVRFMIQDLIDLRNNKWVPRRDDTNPKTMDQIQKDADRESMETSLAFNTSQDRNKRQDSRNSLDNRKRGGGAADSSGWMTVQQNRGKYIIESSKLKLDQSEVDVASTVSLGNRNQFAIWGQGLGGAKSDPKKMPQTGNMFALLNDKISQPSSRNSSLKGSSMNDKDRAFSSYKTNCDDDGRSSRSGSQQGPDSRSSSRDSVSSKHDDKRYLNANRGQANSKSSTSSNNLSGEPKSPDVLQKQARYILVEYISSCELEDAELSAKRIISETRAEDFAINICRAAIEMNNTKSRRTSGKLINHFLKKNILSKKHLLQGLFGVVETAEDLVLDIPLIWTYFAEVIVDIFAEDNLSFRELAELLKSKHGSVGVQKFLSCFFVMLSGEKPELWIQERWLCGQVNLTDLIEDKDVDNFVKQNKLEYLLNEKDINSITMDTIKSEIYRMISSKTSFNEVLEWINDNVSSTRISSPEFIKTLMTVLLETSVTGQNDTFKFDEDTFRLYDQLILRYVDHCEQLELTCLYALQAFLHKLIFPKALGNVICNYLWDNELIALESFILWLDTEDPKEREGHAVCVKSLRAFITVLKENVTDEES